MSKYSKGELKIKAKYVVAAEGTQKYLNLIMRLAVEQGLMPQDVEQKIRKYVNS